MNRRMLFSVGLLVAALALVLPASADHLNPAVTVSDQVSVDGHVVVDKVNYDGPGFIVIHADNGEGSFGAVIGSRAINAGNNFNVAVPIDTTQATGTLYAMLHTDDGEIGVYEFGAVEGADAPVAVEGEVVSPAFNVDIVHAADQLIENNTVTIASVTAQAPGWLVVHAGMETFGAVLGQTLVDAGTTTDVVVELSGDMTDVLWPMLHLDTGTEGEYEFGAVEGADGPVVVNGAVATMPIWTVPHIRVPDQAIIHGDGMEMMDDMAPTLHATSVLSDGPGFLVVHQAAEADDGSLTFGAVIGVTAVDTGTNLDVTVELDADSLTPLLWPMLHTDDNTMGEYEFGSVEGADAPVAVNGAVVTFAINSAPSITYDGTIDGNSITMDQAVIDAPGWLVIHADNGEGSFGAVLGQTQISTGLNSNIVIEIDEMGLTDTLYPMLHYDTDALGEYEFGAVEGADNPVFVNGNVVFAGFVPTPVE